MVFSFKVSSGIQDFNVAFTILLEIDWQLEHNVITWQETTGLPFNPKPTILSLVKRDLMTFLPWIRDRYVDFVDTFAPVRCIIMCGALLTMAHNTVRSIVHLFWRKEKNWVEFADIQLSNALGRVSVKGYRQNWQESVPGEQKVNYFLNTNCNQWHFNRFLKHVQHSIIQLHLQKVTLITEVFPQTSAISESQVPLIGEP